MVDLATTQKAYLRIDEIQEIFGRSRRTIYYWIERGKLPVETCPVGVRVPTRAVKRLAVVIYGCLPSTQSVQRIAKSA